jgi:hypothetical protein
MDGGWRDNKRIIDENGWINNVHVTPPENPFSPPFVDLNGVGYRVPTKLLPQLITASY